jgi:hypothetical protein
MFPSQENPGLAPISHHGGTEPSLLGRRTGTEKKAGKRLRITGVVTRIDGLAEWSFLVFFGLLRVLRASVVILVRNAG